MNLPKLSPIGNVNDIKEKSDSKPENSGINNNDSNKPPELQKLSSNNNKLGNSYFNVREDINKVSPNKKIVNLDPIQYIYYFILFLYLGVILKKSDFYFFKFTKFN